MIGRMSYFRLCRLIDCAQFFRRERLAEHRFRLAGRRFGKRVDATRRSRYRNVARSKFSVSFQVLPVTPRLASASMSSRHRPRICAISSTLGFS